MVQIIIDIRERDLIQELTDQTLITEALSVGDIVLRDDDVELIIERKSLMDLAASIKDGRYAEQKQRLACLRSQENPPFIAILVEGRLSYDDLSEKKTGGLPNKTIVSAVLNMAFRDGFHVMRTDSLAETANLVRSLASRISKFANFRSSSQESAGCCYEPNVIKSVKRQNTTQGTVLVSQLCTIPMVSTKTATAIKDFTGARSLTELVDIMSICADAGAMLLSNAPGVGASVAESVVTFLGVKPSRSPDIERFFPRLVKNGN